MFVCELNVHIKHNWKRRERAITDKQRESEGKMGGREWMNGGRQQLYIVIMHNESEWPGYTP